MEFTLRKASDWDFEETITINTLEDLKELQNKYSIPDNKLYWKNPGIIVDFNNAKITIYDYYLE